MFHFTQFTTLWWLQAVKISTDIFLPFLSGSQKNMALNLSLLVKSAGFLPEVESHDELFRFTMGVTIRF